MRGIMTARTKPLSIVEQVAFDNTTTTINFEKPEAKGTVKLVSADNLAELVNLLHTEAKVI
jgi:electron transfer flavoprotein beta subunit